jgi:hypothetical protein
VAVGVCIGIERDIIRLSCLLLMKWNRWARGVAALVSASPTLRPGIAQAGEPMTVQGDENRQRVRSTNPGSFRPFEPRSEAW